MVGLGISDRLMEVKLGSCHQELVDTVDGSEIPRPTTQHLWKPVKNGISTISTGDRRISGLSTVPTWYIYSKSPNAFDGLNFQNSESLLMDTSSQTAIFKWWGPTPGAWKFEAPLSQKLGKPGSFRKVFTSSSLVLKKWGQTNVPFQSMCFACWVWFIGWATWATKINPP